MKFRLNVNVTDADYYDFNKFYMFHSKTAAKSRTLTRITAILMYVVFGWLFIKAEGFSFKSGVFIGFLVIVMVIMQIFLNKFFWLLTKRRIDVSKKKGNLKYSKAVVYEFYDDIFHDITETEKSEVKYCVIECVRVIEGRMILLQRSENSSYILPVSCFTAKEECEAFLSFIKTKCPKIEFYEKV